MKYLRVVFLVLVSGGSLYGQGFGFKGSRFQLEFNYSPNLRTDLFLNNAAESSSNRDISEYFVIGGKNGFTRLGLYKSKGLSASYILNRKSSIGVQFTNQKILGQTDLFWYDDSPILEYDVNTVLIKYDYHSAIAPFKRYLRFGIGMDFLKSSKRVDANGDKADENEIPFKFHSRASFFVVGIGTNWFITDHIYLNTGVDLNIYPFLILDSSSYTDEDDISAYEPLLYSKPIKFQFGLGINI